MSSSNAGIILQWTGTRRIRAPPVPPERWAQYQEEICRLHTSMKLAELMVYLKDQYDFEPSRHQLVLQLQKWGCRKYKSKTDSNSPTDHPRANGPATDWEGHADVSNLPLNNLHNNCHGFDEDDIGMDEGVDHEQGSDRDNNGPRSQPDIGKGLLEAVQMFEEEFNQVFRSFEVPDTWDFDQPASDTLGVASFLDTTLDEPEAQQSSPRRTNLKRVPRVQKRPRSISSMETVQAESKRNRHEAGESKYSPLSQVVMTEFLEADDIFCDRTLYDRSPQVLFAEATCTMEGDSTPTTHLRHRPRISTSSEDASSGTETLDDLDEEDCNTSLLSPPSRDTTLMNLIRLANEGQTLGANACTNRDKIQKLAWFFFGARLFDEAFVLHLLVYKSLRAASWSDDKTLFPIVIDMARCSRTDAQDDIVKTLLLQMSRKREWRRRGDLAENFLLHSFMTIIYNRQNNPSKADHHCHQAIQFFQRLQNTDRRICRHWRSLSAIAWTRLGLSVTEKRLAARDLFISTEVRRKICSRGSDQLILWSSIGTQNGALSDPTIDNSKLSRALRSLFQWCLATLETHSNPFDSRHSWRRLRAQGTRLRDLGLATLFCELWKSWQQHESTETTLSGAAATLTGWAHELEHELGVDAGECLATVPHTIALEWPVLDEDIPLLANWRTYLQELQRRAAASLRVLLQQSDLKLAHNFFEAYNFNCIAPQAVDVACDPLLDVRKECIVSFVDRNIDFSTLSLGDPANRSSQHGGLDSMADLDAEIDAWTATSSTLSVAGDAESISSLGPVMSRPALRNSIRSWGSVSVDLISMDSLRRRAAQNCIGRQPSDAESKLPSKVMKGIPECDTANFDDMIGLARRSMDSLSVHDDPMKGVWEQDVQTSLLRDPSSNIGVIVH